MLYWSYGWELVDSYFLFEDCDLSLSKYGQTQNQLACQKWAWFWYRRHCYLADDRLKINPGDKMERVDLSRAINLLHLRCQ